MSSDKMKEILNNSPINEKNIDKIINKNNKNDFRIKFMSGLIGSTLSSFVCSPLDLIKIRMQTEIENKNPKYKNFFHAIKTIYIEEGVKGFFKGAKIAVVTIPVFYSLYFPLYEKSKKFYSGLIYKQENKFNSIIYTLSSGTTALICDLITNPLWVVRVRKQTEFIHSGCQKMDSFNILREVKLIHQREGFFALYRGLVASVFGIPHVIIQFNIYEFLKVFYTKKYSKEFSDLPLHNIFLISIIAKSKK